MTSYLCYAFLISGEVITFIVVPPASFAEFSGCTSEAEKSLYARARCLALCSLHVVLHDVGCSCSSIRQSMIVRGGE
jgi:hypothetical protein